MKDIGMKIFALPAFANKEGNPYNYRLYNAIERDGIDVSDFNLFSFAYLFKKCDIFHVHWPDHNVVKGRLIGNIVKILLFFTHLIFLKIKGAKIVWTVHNIKAHDYDYYNKTNKYLAYYNIYFFIKKFVDGLIVLNNHTIDKLDEQYLNIDKLDIDYSYIPHSNYKGVYRKRGINDSRTDLGISSNNFLFGYFGFIKKYKNVPAFINAFKNLSNEEDEMIIAGKPENEQLNKKIVNLSADNERVHLFLYHIDDDELEKIFSSINLLVLPYKKINNSGSALLSLSLDTPILVPENHLFKDLKNEIENKFEWVFLYQEQLTSRRLYEVAQKIKKRSSALNCKGIEKYDNDKIGDLTLSFYETLV